MSKLLVIFGATGQQGSSVLNYVLNDTELSKEYKIRAITRDVNSSKAKELAEKVEVVQGDVADEASLQKPLTGAHTIFLMTTPSFDPVDPVGAEFATGKTVVDVAVRQGAQYIIFSTLPATTEISGGKYTHITAFDAKANIEKYIRSLPVKSAFFSGGFFMENIQAPSQAFLAPQPAGDGTYVLARPLPVETKLPYLDAIGNIGNFVGAILAEPEKYEGKVFHAAQALYSLQEIVDILSRASGKTVIYKEISMEEFKKTIPYMVELWVDAFGYVKEFGGYFGPETEQLVNWAIKNARGKLTTFDEYFEAHPLQLA